MTGQRKKPRRTRQETEQLMLETALRIIRRDGVLAGLNLADVADEAGVNRGLIYHYFGSRQQLLRTAIERSEWEGQRSEFLGRFAKLPFAKRRLDIFRDVFRVTERSKLLALLVLDNDHEARLFPGLAESREWLARDIETGSLPKGSDPLVSHALTAVLNLGYGIFREQMARELELPLDELDQRVIAVAAHMIQGIATQAAIGADLDDEELAEPQPSGKH